jgi:hypothetical protein
MVSGCYQDICTEELRKSLGYSVLKGISAWYTCTRSRCTYWTVKYPVFISLNDSANEMKFSQNRSVPCYFVAISTEERNGRELCYFVSCLSLGKKINLVRWMDRFHYEELHDLCSSPDIVRMITWVGNVAGMREI